MTRVGDWSSRPDDALPPGVAAVVARVHLTPAVAAVSLHPVTRRRDQCSAVLARIKNDAGKSLLKGSPQLWRIVLDRLAADETVPDVAAALREHLDGVIPPGAMRDVVAARCAAALTDEDK